MDDAPAPEPALEPPIAFFAPEGQGYLPLPASASRWSSDMVTGPAVCGLVARTAERAHLTEGFVPSRVTVDLFRPVRAKRVTTETVLVRDGHRIRVADVEVVQDGVTVARASVVFLRATAQPPGEVWSSPDRLVPPSDEVRAATDGVAPWFGSGDDGPGWTASMADHQGGRRKRMWTRMPQVVRGEEPSPFVRAVMTGETTSMMTNWGTAGVGYINADVTVALARLPVGEEIGIEAADHITADGIAIGSATLYDRRGPIGSCTVTALANAQRQVDLQASRALGR